MAVKVLSVVNLQVQSAFIWTSLHEAMVLLAMIAMEAAQMVKGGISPQLT